MLIKYQKNSSHGFTLVEILVAAGVFALFLTSLFTLYRMGSQMFASGSWKLQKQKESEMFLNNLKERIEQASNPVDIDATGNMDEGSSNLGAFTGQHSGRIIAGINTIDSPTRLLAFVISKPAIANETGLLLYNILRAVPQTGGSGLLRLELLSTININSDAATDFMSGSPFVFFGVQPPNMVARFNQPPQQFGLGGDPSTFTLADVASISISIPPGPDQNLIRIDIGYEHPKYDSTKVSHSITAKVDVNIEEGNL